MQFIGERQGSALHPLKGLLEKSLKNPQNFQKNIFNNTFLKVFGDPRTFFQKGSWPPEAVPLQTQIFGIHRTSLSRSHVRQASG